MRLGRPVHRGAIKRIHVSIQKHGAFYHPAKVDVLVDNQWVAFVVNVAFSKRGQNGLGREFNLVRHLNRLFTHSYIPHVYAMAEVFLDERAGPGPKKVSMFLGEWFNGFHEFHLQKSDTRAPALYVWDPEAPFFLTPFQQKEVYSQVAEILTYYYNPLTFEQIFPWHHAAGDFVVRMKKDSPVLRLITVRGYTSLVEVVASEGEKPDAIIQIEGLFRFFLHLGLRTRIDRLAGTGDLYWAGNTAVDGTIIGFMAGLTAKESLSAESLPYRDLMGLYLSRLSLGDLTEGINGIVESYPESSPEGYLMKHHQDDHVQTVFERIHTLWEF